MPICQNYLVDLEKQNLHIKNIKILMETLRSWLIFMYYNLVFHALLDIHSFNVVLFKINN